MKILSAVLIGVLLTQAAALDKAAEELDMREATYRYQFSANASGLQERASAYYLSIITPDGKHSDPPTKLIKRFVENRPPVKNVSECFHTRETGVVDKKTGERGLIFTTGAIRWISDTDAEISGGYYEAGLSASGSTYHVQKLSGKWQVVEAIRRSIS